MRNNFWQEVTIDQRMKMAQRWFKPFAHIRSTFENEIRCAATTGKPHLYITTQHGELCVTRKSGDRFLVHFPSYGGPLVFRGEEGDTKRFIVGLAESAIPSDFINSTANNQSGSTQQVIVSPCNDNANTAPQTGGV